MVNYSPSVRCHLQGVHFSCRLTCHQSKHESSFVCLSSSSSHGMETRCFSASLRRSRCLHVSPLHHSVKALPRVMLSTNLSIVLVAPLWVQKEWFKIYWLFSWKTLLSSSCYEVFWFSCTSGSFTGVWRHCNLIHRSCQATCL